MWVQPVSAALSLSPARIDEGAVPGAFIIINGFRFPAQAA